MIILKKIGGRAWNAFRPQNDNKGEVSLFDVKELYDAAYAEKANARVNIKRFRSLLEKATKLDAAYRKQLSKANVTRYGRAA
ncbi:hypothetical protein [Profundibacter amoris]|uniref:Uncharacterized protein n=1 Tax=Profundibacter amoris TaxID=2171755 RepID=A0A347UGU7_9RHOB|nr:hypothetical protein [Profundibacter amoris]AXX98075.1 hypothetical protein BAR1_09100 [Profundibacter amoris]